MSSLSRASRAMIGIFEMGFPFSNHSLNFVNFRWPFCSVVTVILPTQFKILHTKIKPIRRLTIDIEHRE